jgi:hypothetical protein
MELTLNLVWVCVAIAGMALLWTSLLRKTRSSDGSTSTRQKIVAMCCALVILFFVISMTDDLHDQAILFEEKKPSRVLSEMANPALSSAAQAIPFVFLLFVSCASLKVAWPTIGWLGDPPQVWTAVAILSEPIDGRAPPLSLA